MFRNVTSEEKRPDAKHTDTAGEPTDKRVDLTDPKVMRALAHPVRMALLELLPVAGTLTATQASEALGESPANCAFHLRTLAKYGFVEEAGGGRGRERPWRTIPMRINVQPSHLDPQAAIAGQSLGRAWEARWFERAQQSLARRDFPAKWEEAVHSTRSMRFLTPEELTRLGDDIHEVFERYGGGRKATDHPAGSLPVELLFFGYPLTHLAALTDAADLE
jgi:DNA-binding transcriptional ArsR family regulator